MSDQPTKAASELVVGDRIAGNFLPGMRAAEVLFTHRYAGPRDLSWVYVTAKAKFSSPDGYYFEPDARIPVESVDLGLTYTRADTDEDPSPVSPARVPLHTGGVIDGGSLVIDQLDGGTE